MKIGITTVNQLFHNKTDDILEFDEKPFIFNIISSKNNKKVIIFNSKNKTNSTILKNKLF